MKKKYTNPDLIIVNIVTTGMIAISQAALDASDEITDPDEFGAREGWGVWGEYEE